MHPILTEEPGRNGSWNSSITDSLSTLSPLTVLSSLLILLTSLPEILCVIFFSRSPSTATFDYSPHHLKFPNVFLSLTHFLQVLSQFNTLCFCASVLMAMNKLPSLSTLASVTSPKFFFSCLDKTIRLNCTPLSSSVNLYIILNSSLTIFF